MAAGRRWRGPRPGRPAAAAGFARADRGPAIVRLPLPRCSAAPAEAARARPPRPRVRPLQRRRGRPARRRGDLLLVPVAVPDPAARDRRCSATSTATTPTARVQDALGGVLPGPAVVETLGPTLHRGQGAGRACSAWSACSTPASAGSTRLREALRTMWHQNVLAGNLIVKKLADVVALVGLFVDARGLARRHRGATAVHRLRARPGRASTACGGRRLFTALLGLALALVTDTVAVPLPVRPPVPGQEPVAAPDQGRGLRRGRLRAAQGAGRGLRGAHDQQGRRDVRHLRGRRRPAAVPQPVSRLLLFTAAWTVTAPYDSRHRAVRDAPTRRRRARPASRGVRRRGPGRPPTLQEHGAPARCRPLQGRVAPQDEPTPRGTHQRRRRRAPSATRSRGAGGGVEQVRPARAPRRGSRPAPGAVGRERRRSDPAAGRAAGRGGARARSAGAGAGVGWPASGSTR